MRVQSHGLGIDRHRIGIAAKFGQIAAMQAYRHGLQTLVESLSTKLPPKSATGEQPEDPKTAMGGHPTRMVPRKGLEPSRPLSHWHLKPARLPIPPPGPGRVSTDRLGGCQIGEP